MKKSNLQILFSFFRSLKVMLLGFLGIVFLGCSEEDSQDIDNNTPIYQRYMVEFSDNGTMAYAHFSKDKDAFFKDVKLEGAQSIRVNGKSMNYNLIEELNISYNYSRNLEKASEVTFVFVRAKNKVYRNSVEKTEISRIALPDHLEVVVNDVAFAWVGESASRDNEVIAVLSRETNDSYADYMGTVTESRKEIVFTGVPAGAYNLTIQRYKRLDTQENNEPAKGEINVFYSDSQKVTVR